MKLQEFNPRNEVREFLTKRKDEPQLVRPSIYYLKNYADEVLRLADLWDSESDSMITDLISIRRALDIFKADLTGELQHE